MPEIVSIRNCPENDPGFFIVAAVTAARRANPDLPDVVAPLEVTLQVNGVEIPFASTVENIFARMREAVDKDVEARVLNVLNDAALLDVQDLLATARANVSATVHRVNARLGGRPAPEDLGYTWSERLAAQAAGFQVTQGAEHSVAPGRWWWMLLNATGLEFSGPSFETQEDAWRDAVAAYQHSLLTPSATPVIHQP